MSMSMVRRRVAGFAKVKRKKQPPAPRPGAAQQAGSGEVRVYAPSAAVGRAVAPKAWWQGLLKPLGIGSGLALAGLATFVIINSPSRPASAATTERYEYPRSASLPHSRVVGAAAARTGGPAFAGAKEEGPGGGREMVVLVHRGPQTAESFRAAAYTRKKVDLPDGKIYVTATSGECVVGAGGSLGDCLRD